MQLSMPMMFVRPAIFAAVFVLTACGPEGSQVPSSPLASTMAPAAPRFKLSNGLTVLNAQLGALSGSTASAYGHIQVKLNPTPADPCGPTTSSPPSTGFAAIAICGGIENPQGDDILSRAGLYFLPTFPSDEVALLVAGLSVTIPGNPVDQCRNLSLRGGAQISQTLADAIGANPAQYQIRFGALGGQFGIPGNPVRTIPGNPVIPASLKCDGIVTNFVSF